MNEYFFIKPDGYQGWAVKTESEAFRQAEDLLSTGCTGVKITKKILTKERIELWARTL